MKTEIDMTVVNEIRQEITKAWFHIDCKLSALADDMRATVVVPDVVERSSFLIRQIRSYRSDVITLLNYVTGRDSYLEVQCLEMLQESEDVAAKIYEWMGLAFEIQNPLKTR